MRLRLGVGERFGPFWAGLTLRPRRYFENTPESDSLYDSTHFGCGFVVAVIFAGTGILVAAGLFVAFLVLLL